MIQRRESLAVRRRLKGVAFLAGRLEARIRSLLIDLPEPAVDPAGEVSAEAPNWRGRLEALLADTVGPARRELDAIVREAGKSAVRSRSEAEVAEPTIDVTTRGTAHGNRNRRTSEPPRRATAR